MLNEAFIAVHWDEPLWPMGLWLMLIPTLYVFFACFFCVEWGMEIFKGNHLAIPKQNMAITLTSQVSILAATYSLTNQVIRGLHLSLVMRKPVFGGLQPGKTQNRPAQLQRLASLDILDLASICIIISKQRTTKALIRLRGCAVWSASLLFAYGIRQVFS